GHDHDDHRSLCGTEHQPRHHACGPYGPAQGCTHDDRGGRGDPGDRARGAARLQVAALGSPRREDRVTDKPAAHDPPRTSAPLVHISVIVAAGALLILGTLGLYLWSQ